MTAPKLATLIRSLPVALASIALVAASGPAQGRNERAGTARSRDSQTAARVDTLRVAGRVTLGSRTLDTTRLEIFVQSGDRAFSVTNRNPPMDIAVGDSIEAIGERDEDDGIVEVERAKVRRIAGPSRLPATQPLRLRRDELARWVGHLVSVSAVINTGGRGRSDRLTVSDTGDSSVSLRITSDRGGAARLDLDRFAPGDRLQAVGVLTARSRNGESTEWVLFPRSAADLTAIGMTRRDMARALMLLAGLLATGALIAVLRSRRARQAAERTRHEADELVRAILNGTSHLIVYTGTDGIVQALNTSAAEVLGSTEADAIGLPILRLYDSDSVRQRAAELSDLSSEGVQADFSTIIAGVPATGSDEREWKLRRWDGRTFPVLASTTALYAPDGSIRGYAVVASDITSRRMAESEAEGARVAAERANRVKSEFLANMSHELRTPLNSVIGFANILLKNKAGRLAEHDLAYLSRITANGRHLLGLINGILDLSKIEAGRIDLEWADMDLSALVRETIGELESQAVAKGVTLSAELPSQPVLLRADLSRVKQMIINLVANALRFTERGEVSVCVTADAEGRATRLDVRDTGCGIPADRLEAVFDAFRQADSSTTRQHGGTGLGLTITRSLGQLMGFDVAVASTPGVGSTFSIVTSPWAAHVTPRPAAVAVAQAAELTPGPRRLTALVIDDDADARDLLGQQLRDLGCEVIEATSAAEGVAMARKHLPDLITLDIMMPQATGISALTEIRRDPMLVDVPIVIISIVAEEFRGQLQDASALLEKPVTAETLADVLHRTLAPARRPELILLDEPNLGDVVGRIRSRRRGDPAATTRLMA